MSTKCVYKVIFYNNEDIFEIYASHIFASDLYGFVEVEQLLFGEKNQLVVDPSEERLKTEFAGVKRTFIPMNAVIRIDEVEQGGIPKVSGVKSTVSHFPSMYKPEK